MSFFLKAIQDPNIEIAAIAAVLIPVAMVVLLRRRRHHHHAESNYNNYPRCLPCSWMETSKNIASPQAIWFIAKWAKEIGFVYRLPIPLPQLCFAVGDPVLARDILNDPTTTKPRSFYANGDEAVGAANIFSANGERWKHARKATASAFSSAHIKRMNQVCKDKLEDWIARRLEGFCSTGEPFDIAEEIISLTLSIICEAAFEYEMKEYEAAFFVHELDLAIREFLVKRGGNPIRKTWLGYLYAYDEIRRATLAGKNIRSIAENILQCYRNKKDNEKRGEMSHQQRAPSGTVIERIVNNEHYNNDKERIADILIFLIGGHDTTAYTVAWTLLELAGHPDEMQNVRRELENLPSEEERIKSPALDNVIKESMRLHPVAAIYLREVHRDFHVNDDDHQQQQPNGKKDDTTTSTTIIRKTSFIPKGSIIFIVNFLLHRHPQYFDQPDEFIPARWSSSSSSATANNNNNKADASTNNNIAFAPFSLGARNCVGQALAGAELHSVVARLVMDYDFEVIDPGQAECTLTLKPSGLKLKATKKQQSLL